MRIPATQRLIVEDFPKQKDWISALFYVLNRFITSVISVLNGGLLFSDNFIGEQKVISFTYASASSFPVGFKWGLAQKPTFLEVGQATENGTSVMMVVSWLYTDTGFVNITNAVLLTSAPAVTALTSGNAYQVVVRVTP